MSMSAIDAVFNLCEILVESNVQLCKQIQEGGGNGGNCVLDGAIEFVE